MSAFVTRGPMTQDSVNDTALVLQHEEWVGQLALGSNWNTLRVGMLMAVGFGSGGGPVWPALASIPVGYGFVMGLCSGTSNPLGAVSTTNFLGVSVGIETGLAVQYPYANNYIPVTPGATVYQKTGTTLNKPATFTSGSCGIVAVGNLRRMIMIVEIQKGSPNYTIFWRYPYSLGAPAGYPTVIYDFTVDELKSAVAQLGTILLRGGSVTFDAQSYSLPLTESAGVFDTVDIYSALPTYGLEVYEVAVQKLA